jgi:phosphatidylglycerol:prolipoprotein diacylglycerol transferase
MLSFLHTFQPQAILISYGHITIHWYGLFIVSGILAALAISFWLAKYYEVDPDLIFDLSFWLIIGGIAGARLYDIGLQLPYYYEHPGQILAIWKGGLAIHGSILAGLAIIWLFSKRHKIDFWRLSSLLVPGLVIGQAIGRWGNYFNQELFGLPTSLPWGIPIDLANRPWQYIGSSFFHPTFLYESLGCLAIGLALIIWNVRSDKKRADRKGFYVCSVSAYMILYSLLRFSLEFIRIDDAPVIAGLRWPQIASLILIILFTLLLKKQHAKTKKTVGQE